MSKTASLSPKHWKAIELIAEGRMTMKQIAETVGFATTTLYALYEGHESMKGTGQLFSAEIKKITKKNEEQVKKLLGENKNLAMRLINDFLKRKLALEYQTDDDVKLISTVTNALSKSTPGVEIHNTSFSYTKGLSAEDLMHEFNKLSSIAKGALVSRGVQGSGQGAAGRLPESPESGDRFDKEPEATDLQPDA